MVTHMDNSMRLFYRQPAKIWEETLPIGNGSLGAMIFGGIEEEKLGLNEETLWSGYYKDKNNADAFPYLSRVRQLIFEGKNKEAELLMQETMLGEYNESYLPLGNLYMRFSHGEEVDEYIRELDIDHSVAKVTYQKDGVTYQREYFSSYPQQAIFMKLTASEPVMDIEISLDTELRASFEYQEDGIRMFGQCPEHVDPSYIERDIPPIVWGEKGQKFKAQLLVLSCDGTCKSAEKLHITDAGEVVLMYQAVKDARNWENKTYDEIKTEHTMDYESIYQKVALYLGDQLQLPTDERLRRLKEGKEDNALYALFFQYGRYLLISSSRTGSLAANLQGIWNWKFRAPWSSNWTTNINTQMNYWPAQSCNLTECMDPYFDLVKNLVREGKKTAAVNYHCRGFVHHHNADYWYNTNPVGLATGEKKGGDGSVTWSFWPMGGAWLVSEFYKHYEYTGDKEFLKNCAYPVLKEAAMFLIDWLVMYQGEYVTCPSTSPENRFITKEGEECAVAMSSAMDLAMIREVFGDFKKTCQELKVADEILPEIEERLSKLTDFKIGSLGQLLEWNEEFQEKELGHRHISHLYGLFPSELFEKEERLKNACSVSLNRRLANGGGYTGWSCAWIINMFAILGDGEKAYEYLHTLLTRSTYDNLWDAHPPFQIDGNFGGTAGIANMLVQDRGDRIRILPALPRRFTSGYVKGLRLKHNKAIDIYWEDGKETRHRIYPLEE